jgi:MFS transporter, DHA1 family, tetracycline resistance protein
LLFALPSYLLIAFAPNTPIMLMAVAIGCLVGMTFPAMQGMMTSIVEEDRQGELQGAIVSTIGLTAIIGPILMTHVFAAFSDDKGLYFPGAPFVVAAGLMLIAIIVLWRTLKRFEASKPAGPFRSVDWPMNQMSRPAHEETSPRTRPHSQQCLPD